MGEVMKEAAFSLAEAKFATGDFNQVVLQNVTKAQIKIRTKKDNVAGVTLPVFESYTVSWTFGWTQSMPRVLYDWSGKNTIFLWFISE